MANSAEMADRLSEPANGIKMYENYQIAAHQRTQKWSKIQVESTWMQHDTQTACRHFRWFIEFKPGRESCAATFNGFSYSTLTLCGCRCCGHWWLVSSLPHPLCPVAHAIACTLSPVAGFGFELANGRRFQGASQQLGYIGIIIPERSERGSYYGIIVGHSE